MNFAIRRFDFSGLQDFASPAVPMQVITNHTLPEVEELAPPPPPSFSEGELMAAKAAAWEEGRAAGIKEEAERQNSDSLRREQAVEAAAQKIVLQMQDLLAQYAQFKVLQTRELGALMMLLVRKVAGDVLALEPASPVEKMIEECLGILQAQPRITVSVHPDIAPQIDAKLRAMVESHRLETSISIRTSPQLNLSDARIDWADGSAERNTDNLWQQVEATLQKVNFAQLAEGKA